jgi:hypothetical protein
VGVAVHKGCTARFVSDPAHGIIEVDCHIGILGKTSDRNQANRGCGDIQDILEHDLSPFFYA